MDYLHYKLKSILQPSCHTAFMALWGGLFQSLLTEIWSCVDEVQLIVALQWWDKAVNGPQPCTCQLLLCCRTSTHRNHCPSPFLGFAMGTKVSCICPKQTLARSVQSCMRVGEGIECPFKNLVLRLDLVQVSIYYKQTEFFRCVGNSGTMT